MGKIAFNSDQGLKHMTMGENSVLNTWLIGVNAGKLDEVVALYDENAILLPTFSTKILSDHQSIEDYFKGLAHRGKVCVNLLNNSLSSHTLGDSLRGIYGFYKWHFVDEDLSLTARFTYLTDTSKPSPILHHHSSLVP